MEELLSTYSIFIIVAFILWLLTLISHLSYSGEDINDTDKIIWTIVLCTLTILGMVLYWFMAPRKKLNIRSEAELKKHFNNQK